ncbi:hypothetical protein KAU09_02425 [Candidatus Parcubacteria bacterium]|nr:hypothetical protein [Candidatus Parcubacteria bacterium]
MKFLKFTIYALILIAAFTAVGFARAQINPMLDFTGKITETDGSELADGVYNMSFRLYSEATGGASLWSEDLTAANCFSGTINIVGSSADGIVYTYSGGSASSTLRVGQYLSSDSSSAGALIVDFNHAASTITVASSSEIWPMGDVINNRPFIEGGVINVALGSVSSLASVDFNQPLYLEVVFNSETMQPRELYNSAASAFNADKLDGYDASDFANLSTDAAISGEWSFEEILSIATSSSISALTVTQNGSGNIVEFKKGTSTYLSVLNDGRVQIGDYILPADSAGASAGYVLKFAASGEMYWDVDFAGSGGGSGLWASSSNDLFIFQSDSGQAVVLGNNSTTSPIDVKLEVEGSSWFDVVGISGSQELRFYDFDSSNYMAIRASSSYASNFILTLPADAGTDGKALITDGNGNLRWGAPTSFTYVNPGTIGQIPYYAEIGSALSATSSIFISTAGYFGIGTTTPAALLSVGANIGSQLLINENGTVTAGAWQGNIIGVAYGGTGTSTFEANSLLYAPVDNTIGEILAGTDGYVLKMTGGIPVWQPDLTVGGESSLWATTSDSLAIRPTDINQVIIIGGAATTTDNIDLEVIGNAAFGGSVSAQELSLLNALAVAYGGTGSTTPSGILLGDGAGNIVSLQNNSNNWNTAYSWGNHSGQGYLSTTSNHILEVAFGGTGTSTFEANSLVYASADNILSQIMPGANGYALVMQGGTPTWASTSPGTSHDLLSAMHPDTEPAVTARGDLIFGSSTAKWTRLGLGPTGYILRSDGIDAAWSTTTDITALGVIEAGTWQADVISPLFGGTGKSSWQSGSIVFATSSDIIDELLIGAEGRILQAVNGKPVWVATSSLGIDFNGIGGTLGAESGGTGADSSGWNGMVQVVSGSWSAINGVANQVAYWTDASTIASEAQLSPSRGGTGADMTSATGFLYFDNGVSIASNTIAVIRTDLTDDNSGVELTGNVLSLNTGGNWAGTFDGYEVNQLFILADWLATTSAPQLVNLENLATVGTITVGAWNGDPIIDAYIASSSHWNLAYFGRVTGANNNLTFTDNQIGVAGGYEIPSTASTSKWNSAYNTVTAGSADWDAVFASSSIYDLVYASSTYYDIAYNWGSHASAGYFTLADWYATSTDALDEGTTNLYWSDSRFDDQFDGRLLATTSISSIIELPNLSFVGVIATGTWQGDTIGVAHGGTGFSSISNQSLVYASSENTLAGFPIGDNGEVLIVSGGNLTWASTSPASQHGILSVTHSDVDATSTLARGDLMVVNSDNKWSRLELGPTGYILYSDGADAHWATTTSITALGEIVQGSWKADPIALAYGGTGAATATGARENLDLDEVYKFGITSTGTDGYVWQSDGDGQGVWAATSSLGLDSSGITQTYSKFIGTTTAISDGHIATGTLSGYAAANAICDYEFAGSHFCRTYDILVSIEQDDISGWGTANPDAWIAEGPPGYTANSNDCDGWNTNDISYLGAFWIFNGNTGGYGKLVNCTQTKSLACCMWQ